ncbi:MAG: DUF368 domain-containing protein [Bacillota bacterium]
MRLAIKGLILGLAIVLPGMSGGTILIILGMYEQILKDIAKINIKPYWPLLSGCVAGLFLGGFVFALVFEAYRDMASAFLLGCMFASTRAVFRERPSPTLIRLGFLAAGLALGYWLAEEPIAIAENITAVNPVVLALGGAIASATMMIPGLPGSSVLIILGIYDDVLVYMRDFHLLNLAIFGFGNILGIFLLARALDNLFKRYQGPIAYFFAGLILGSTRAILPGSFGPLVALLFIGGFALVWWYSGKEEQKDKEKKKEPEELVQEQVQEVGREEEGKEKRAPGAEK